MRNILLSTPNTVLQSLAFPIGLDTTAFYMILFKPSIRSNILSSLQESFATLSQSKSSPNITMISSTSIGYTASDSLEENQFDDNLPPNELLSDALLESLIADHHYSAMSDADPIEDDQPEPK